MTTIEQAHAMIERLELEESAFYIVGDSDAASTLRGAMRCIQSLITAVEQAQNEALERAKRIADDAAKDAWATACHAKGNSLQWHTAAAAHEEANNISKAIRALITGKDK